MENGTLSVLTYLSNILPAIDRYIMFNDSSYRHLSNYLHTRQHSQRQHYNAKAIIDRHDQPDSNDDMICI
jgi:hypothetical protein